MITELEFFERLRPLYKESVEYEQIFTFDDMQQIIRHCYDLDDGSKKMQLRKELYEVMSDAPMKIPGLALFYDISEAKAAVQDESLVDSFIYDRGTKTVILNINRGGHESFCGKLYCSYHGLPFPHKIQMVDDMAAKYIEEGLGFFQSSRAGRPMKGKNVVLNAQERTIFGTNFREI